MFKLKLHDRFSIHTKRYPGTCCIQALKSLRFIPPVILISILSLAATPVAALYQAGNVTTTQSNTAARLAAKAVSALSLTPSSFSILKNQTINVTGKLTRLPDTGVNLDNLQIELRVTAPDSTVTTFTTRTSTSKGEYTFSAISGFNTSGSYTLSAFFAGNTDLDPETSLPALVNVDELAGYALIVQGRVTADTAGLLSHNKTTNRIYNTLIKRGFQPDNILYYNFDNTQTDALGNPFVDGIPSKTLIQNAIENELPVLSSTVAAPVYIFMVDHGGDELFQVGPDTISAVELDSWMTTMEASLSPAMQLKNRFLIYGACYSGSFIPALSSPGRILITSAAADEESYKGPIEPADGIRTGEFFIEELMKQLERGDTFTGAFNIATTLTETYTRISNTQSSFNRFFDAAAQHPLLDDNGDGIGTNLLDNNSLDGNPSKSAHLGVGLSFLTSPVPGLGAIDTVTETSFVEAGNNTLTLFLEPISGSDVGLAWFEVRKPTKVLTDPDFSSVQLELELDTVDMTLDPVTGLWEGTYNGFDEIGQYEIFYYVKDLDTDVISPTKRSVVYKKQSGNQPPSTVTLLSPADASIQKTVMTFDWTDATDPDDDVLSYTLEIASDALFTVDSIEHRIEELAVSSAIVDQSALLPDFEPLFWRVITTDQFGATSTSPPFSLNTDNTNGVPGVIQGLVFSNSTFARLAGANVSSPASGNTIAVAEYNGEFILISSAGENITLEVSSTGGEFATKTISGISVTAGQTTSVNIGIDTDPANTGDGGTTGTGDGTTTTQAASTGGGGMFRVPDLLIGLGLMLIFLAMRRRKTTRDGRLDQATEKQIFYSL